MNFHIPKREYFLVYIANILHWPAVLFLCLYVVEWFGLLELLK